MPQKKRTAPTKGNYGPAANSKENSKEVRVKRLTPHRFKPGQSGNPSGRPKKLLTEAYQAILGKKFPGDPKKRTFAELIAESMAKEAIKGKPQAAIEIADRTEGKSTQAHELSGPRGAPISVQSRTPQEIEKRISELLGKGRYQDKLRAGSMGYEALSPEELDELEQLLMAREQYAGASKEERQRIQYRASLEADFSAFVKAAWHVIRPGVELKWSWHYDLIAEWLTLVYERKCLRLRVNMPPRTLKSIIVTVMFPVWVWTKQATHNFATASYSGELSTEHSVLRRNLIESDWFKGLWEIKSGLQRTRIRRPNIRTTHRPR